jgi:MFS transporter, DHA1 family, tetracycline resistance protein
MVRAAGRAAFAFVFVTVMLDMLSLGIAMPVLPKLVERFEGGDIARAVRMTGVFSFTWAVMQFIFQPIIGGLSDRYGRRPVILLSNFGLGIDYLVMALAPSLGWLFIGRVSSGITAASFSSASAYIADVTPPEKRAQQFGMLGAAFGLGFIVGPAVGGLLGGIDLRLPFWVAAALSLANACYGFFILPESLPRERRAPFSLAKANPVGSLDLFRSKPGMLGLAGGFFLYLLAHDSLPGVFVLYADYRYGWRERTIGAVLALVGLCSTIVAAGLVGPVVRRLGERRALVTGLTFGAAGFFIYGMAWFGWMFVAGVAVMAPWGIAGPSMQALMTRRVGPNEQGRLQGAMSSLRGITGMLAPLIFTQIFAAAIAPGRGVHVPGAPYLLASALIVASGVVGWYAARPAEA